MIFYFTGTGNSYYVAKMIAQNQGVELRSISKELDHMTGPLAYELKENDLMGIVFPVYAWGPPKPVLDFIDRLQVSGGNPYVFSLSTCGEEEGDATRIIQKALRKNSLSLDSAFGLQMPNNYMVGFDVDTREEAVRKLKRAEHRLEGICDILNNRHKGVFQIISGRLPILKTSLVYPLFNRFALNAKRFSVTEDCTGCGLCERICPVHTITVQSKPVWQKYCVQCFGCINLCPVQAIQYGKGTRNKGRYVHPDYQKWLDT